MDKEEDFESIPKFGDSKSTFEDVVNFYGFWESYSTKKSYVWLFTHDISEIRDRKVLKHLEKEHKKIQQKARKERNEEIRSLTLFVKKRDKRMQEYRKMLEEKAQQNRLKSEQNRLDQIRKRNEELREQQQNSKVSSEMQEQIRKLEESYFNQYDDGETSENDSCDEEELSSAEMAIENSADNCDDFEENFADDELYCVACNKFFSNESSKRNHEASKKHRSNVELLKQKMQKDEDTFKESGAQKLEINAEEEHFSVHSTSFETLEDEKLKQKKSKKKKLNRITNIEEGNANEAAKSEDNLVELLSASGISETLKDDPDCWSKKSKKSKAYKGKSKSNEKQVENLETGATSLPKDNSKDEVKATNPIDENAENRCATCGQIFKSKNKLFDHLKRTNHSVYLGEKLKKPGKNNSRSTAK